MIEAVLLDIKYALNLKQNFRHYTHRFNRYFTWIKWTKHHLYCLFILLILPKIYYNIFLNSILLKHTTTTKESSILSNLSFKFLQIYRGMYIIHNTSISDITMATDDKAISNECTNNLIINFIKTIRNMKKKPR